MFTTIIRPRVSETDGMGHINNTTFPVWFEAGREGIFRIFTPDLSFSDWKAVIVNLSIDYIKETHYGTEVEVRTWIAKVGNSSFIVEEEIHQDGHLGARGKATYVNFNQATRRAEPIPPAIREQLDAHKKETY